MSTAACQTGCCKLSFPNVFIGNPLPKDYRFPRRWPLSWRLETYRNDRLWIFQDDNTITCSAESWRKPRLAQDRYPFGRMTTYNITYFSEVSIYEVCADILKISFSISLNSDSIARPWSCAYQAWTFSMICGLEKPADKFSSNNF